MKVRASSMLLASALIVAALALCATPSAAQAAPRPMATYIARLAPTFVPPPNTRRYKAPYGTATVAIYNDTYAMLAWDVRNIVGATMMHIHNGTLTMPGGVVVWGFQSTLPGVNGFNPVSGSFATYVPFDPTATGAGGLLMNNMAYFNVHTAEYPGGAINGMFTRRS